LQRDHAEELIKKRVYDSQVSKKLLKQILLERHTHQISCKQVIDWVTGGANMDIDGEELMKMHVLLMDAI